MQKRQIANPEPEYCSVETEELFGANSSIYRNIDTDLRRITEHNRYKVTLVVLYILLATNRSNK